ncbi:MAG: hypothetical protein Q8K96_02415 [Rubrivivax sp.]|jgi:hypothetical protein|nr:hypothetical protein [Rubrivivax sp.]
MSTDSAIGHVFALERDAFGKARLQRCSNGGRAVDDDRRIRRGYS